MSLSLQHFWKMGWLCLFVALAGADVSFAGWMGFKNDTKETLIIVETITVNGLLKQGRPQRLFMGEAVRDAQCVGGQRKISVFDPKLPNIPIYTGNFPCPATNENLLYSLKPNGKGGITVEAIETSPTTPK